MNAKEREGGREKAAEDDGREEEEEERDEDGLSRGQRKEECIPGRVNPWGLEWLTIPWIRAFRLAPRLFHDRARSRTCNQHQWVRGNQPFLYHRRLPRSIPRFLISRDSAVNGS